MNTVRAYLGLGSNLGDRHGNLRKALAMLDAREGIDVAEASTFIETDPVGGPEGQPKFVNAAVAVDTTLSPRELLGACQEVERALGRERGPDEVRWGPRTIDIDILLYGKQVVDEPDLRIPHPRMHEREFVLVPLAQIAPEITAGKSAGAGAAERN
jgi:2-amino-4-hydroxy-6-hydroxymethyldihydropteridine diphosphokinase